MKSHARSGFTIIEVIVVIAIIGILASIVMGSIKFAKVKAQSAVARSNMSTIAKILSMAQGESSKTLRRMSIDGGATHPDCSGCIAECLGTDLRNIPDTNACYDEWSKVVAGIKLDASGLGDGMSGMLRDPWGSPYLIDQNQGQTGLVDCSNIDMLKSAGPDGIASTSDDIKSPVELPLGQMCP